jgi:peptidoglycan/LPS O-acetylase OafA/YrhL
MGAPTGTSSNGAMRAANAVERLAVLDTLKAVACVMIVCHHLAFYGPMSDVARPLAPDLIDWLAQYGRLAVQVFLVAAGFLLARSMGLGRWPHASPMQQIGRRYVRLVAPYAVALVAAMLAAAYARTLMQHSSVPDAPHWSQWLAHMLLLHDLVGVDALSAGVWYVAIDFQLFAMAVAVCALARRVQGERAAGKLALEVCCIVLLALASLLWFNLQPGLDVTALYFAGSYGLGMLAGWSTRAGRRAPWIVGIAALGVAALLIDWRERIAVSLCMALLLAALHAVPPRFHWPLPRVVRALSQMSYAVFLVHFPVCMVVNAWWRHLWPTDPWWNAVGMLVAVLLSLVAGALLHRMERWLIDPRAALQMLLVGERSTP